ncbi:MAG: DNA polymerase III subunit delta [Flavobacteriales bacterium]|jgi:DNA polymerase-3 subunit delta'|nr:DNA polymerase III subunit delta [Flavobacteriales bacterium]MBK6881508.1 DNA polymerase III subunit delta [Flavobacteriales bacterium]MBK7113569.1 DNA polymerase III subunit delta [Flavobacteriales bacterium]MBK7482446.1 DNA polymerase III subunit delta [Flavobacteriales bacterium]MBK7619800.1 DNA polymerase III subunit delta [Flavobacteriales bacterium]
MSTWSCFHLAMPFLCGVLFSKVVGHATLKAKLIGNIREGRVAHAQLFMGPRGGGDLPMALAYAQYLLCADRDTVDACGKCPSCAQMAKLEHPDLHLMFPIYFREKLKPEQQVCEPFTAQWRQAILAEPYTDIEQWRDQLESENKQLRMGVGIAQEIQRKLSLRSFMGGYKVMVIWLPELMDTAAANKLLKVLEEPETNTVFLLVSTDAEQLLATILSRAQLTKVPALRPSDLAEALLERFPEIVKDEAMAIALRSEGDLLDAVDMANKGEEELFVFFRDWLRCCYRREVAAVAEFAEAFQKMGRERQKSLIRYGLYLIRQCTLQWQQVPELVRVLGQEQDFVQNFSKLLNDDNVNGIRNELETAHLHIERNANPKILFTDLSYKLMGLLRMAIPS